MSRARRYAGNLSLLVLLACSWTPACGETKPVGQGPPPAGWTDGVALGAPIDLDPDPHVLEVELEARPALIDLGFASPTELWTYNGSVPGPLLHARRGDTLIVHFTNNLPEATTIHWHGVRVPAAMDGTPASQAPVAPGGRFDYRFTLPDAGLFWYHPHLQTTEQVRAGLMGAILVDHDDATADPVDFGPEAVLVLAEAQVDAAGQLAASGAETDPAGIRSLSLVNGHVLPTLLARRGQRQRWHIANAAAGKFFRLTLPGHTFLRIGSDGGLRESAVMTSELILAPAERVDVLVTPDAPLGTMLSVADAGDASGGGGEAGAGLFTLRIAEETSGDLPAVLPPRLRVIPRIDLAPAKRQDIVMSEGTDAEGNFTFEVNGRPFAGLDAGAVTARLGDTHLWTFENRTNLDHPMHLHGYFFQVLDPTTGLGAAEGDGEWKDTVNVPPSSSLSFVVRYDDRPGMWMYHCHILEHADLGLMGMLHVNP